MNGPVYDLSLQNGTNQFFPGITTTTMGVNGDLLGPTLLLKAGESVKMNVQNNLGEPSTIHWHGLHVHPANDGGPHTVIENGTTWSPQFDVLDKAGTYWYHPHLHMKTAEQVTKGIAGLIIVQDEDESKLDLPRAYGIDDIPVVIQSRAFDANKQFITLSSLDNTILVNGALNPFVEVPAQVVRLRILNGSTERVFRFGFEGNHSFYLIGTDGGLLTAPVALTRLNLAPGERIEVLVNLAGLESSSLYIKSFASELSSGIYGAANPSIMPMGSIQGYASNPLNGTDFEILRLDIIQKTTSPILQIPTTLVNDQPLIPNQANTTRSLTFQAAQMNMNTMVNGPFVINGTSFDKQIINYQIPINNIEIWELTNMTAIAHPFHIHDVHSISWISTESPLQHTLPGAKM
ncbi:MAG: multicopper oxidase domain-containing protein [Saprospiraceae bacterium]|nr:multicopper oxidase domain-containing protein [Saprospiraceae bacterium]